MSTKDTVRSELVLRLTDSQVAAIRLRNQRRKKIVGGTGEVDLGDISSFDSDLSQSCTDAVFSEKD
jgi:hypothetical protein